MQPSRIDDLRRFYEVFDRLGKKTGERQQLSLCHGRMPWPNRGAYFFFEHGELRSDSGSGPRVVRVGTHALTKGTKTTLWGRLSQHRGVHRTRGGNHRGSVFRLLVGTALMTRDPALTCSTWAVGSSANREIRDTEHDLEVLVSMTIGQMPFLWLGIEDDPGPASLRGYIERNAIALLSNYNKPRLDPLSGNWLGLSCPRERVRLSGLWNSNHVDESYAPAFLTTLEQLVL